MLPLVADPKCIRVGLAGAGEGLVRRKDFLVASGVMPVLFDQRGPSDADLEDMDVLFVVGLDMPAATQLAARARALGVLVNVEDVPPLCDFHVPAVVRRGDLLLTVSTGGRAPGLASLLRGMLEHMFAPVWKDRIEEIAKLRDAWRLAGKRGTELSRLVQDHIQAKGWLK